MSRNAPGVFVTVTQDTPPTGGAPTPEAVPVIMGLAERGPTWTPTRLSGNIAAEYKAIFGAPLSDEAAYESILSAEANGATEVYFVRMSEYSSGATLAATPSSVTFDTMGAATRASFSGSVTFPISIPSTGLILKTDLNGAGAETSTFSGTAATKTASGGNYNTSSPTSATISYKLAASGPVHTVTAGTALGANTAAAAAAYLNTILPGLSVAVSGSDLLFSTDVKGTSAYFNITAISSEFATRFGTAGITVASGAATGTGNVANLGSVTFAEVKTIVEAATVLTVTQPTATTIQFAATTGALGEDSELVLHSDSSDALVALLGLTEGTYTGEADASEDAVTLFSGYRGVKSVGAFGNDLSVEVAQASKYTSRGAGEDLASSISDGALTMSMVSVSGLSKGSYIVVSDGTNTEYKKIVSIAQTINAEGASVQTVTVDTAFENAFVDADTVIDSIEYDFNVYVNDVLVETLKGLSPNSSSPNYYVDRINSTTAGSRYLFAEVESDDIPLAYVTATDLTGGADQNDVTAVHFLGSADLHSGIYCLDNLLRNGLVIAIPVGSASALPAPETLANIAMVYAAERGDAFVVTHTPSAFTAEDALEFRQQDLGADNENGALYYPWLYVKDTQSSSPTARKLIPPVGAVAGKFVTALKMPSPEGGVAASPAGITQFGALNCLGLERVVTDSDRATLHPQGVNCICAMPDNGRIVYFVDGARTLSSDATSMHIGVVRLRKFITQALKTVLRRFVHRPNTKKTWNDKRSAVIDGIMRPLFAKGQLNGANEASAFYVVCDETTTSPEDVDNNVSNIRVGFVPTKSIEFIEVSLTQHLTNGINSAQ